MMFQKKYMLDICIDVKNAVLLQSQKSALLFAGPIAQLVRST